jgi:hypothetical protein
MEFVKHNSVLSTAGLWRQIGGAWLEVFQDPRGQMARGRGSLASRNAAAAAGVGLECGATALASSISASALRHSRLVRTAHQDVHEQTDR